MAPNQPRTPGRNLRVADPLWAAALAKAKLEGTSVTAVVVSFLEAWVAVPDPLWSSAAEAAERAGTTVPAEVVSFLERYVSEADGR